mmetsp:Transcript_34886/g.45930  ORF Transcript_34886/g.45930 Transcript_34886/m.45930 type:complete len:125 (-) Transcript_34886:214-588(-)
MASLVDMLHDLIATLKHLSAHIALMLGSLVFATLLILFAFFPSLLGLLLRSGSTLLLLSLCLFLLLLLRRTATNTSSLLTPLLTRLPFLIVPVEVVSIQGKLAFLLTRLGFFLYSLFLFFFAIV